MHFKFHHNSLGSCSRRWFLQPTVEYSVRRTSIFRIFLCLHGGTSFNALPRWPDFTPLAPNSLSRFRPRLPSISPVCLARRDPTSAAQLYIRSFITVAADLCTMFYVCLPRVRRVYRRDVQIIRKPDARATIRRTFDYVFRTFSILSSTRTERELSMIFKHI